MAWALLNKGSDLHSQGHYAEAVASYDEVVTRLGTAEESELKVPVAHALVEKGDALCEQKERPEALAAWEKAEEIVAALPEEAILRNNLAWGVYKHRYWPLLGKAQKWAQEAVALTPEDGNCHGTLGAVQYLLGKGGEAIEEARKYLRDRNAVDATVEGAIDLFVGLAATGHAREALRVLQDSPSVDLLEPLVVGLRLYLGEDVKAAAEILEVAKDVVKRIQERRAELESHRTTEEWKTLQRTRAQDPAS